MNSPKDRLHRWVGSRTELCLFSGPSSQAQSAGTSPTPGERWVSLMSFLAPWTVIKEGNGYWLRLWSWKTGLVPALLPPAMWLWGRDFCCLCLCLQHWGQSESSCENWGTFGKGWRQGLAQVKYLVITVPPHGLPRDQGWPCWQLWTGIHGTWSFFAHLVPD